MIFERWLFLQCLIKNKVISGLLVCLVVLVGPRILKVTVGLIQNTTSYGLKEEYHVKIFMPVCQGK